MLRLINANLVRLRKNKIFWILAIFSVAFALIFMCSQDSVEDLNGIVVDVQKLFLEYGLIIGIVIAVFTSLFLGVEYSDGTIRNKIIIGHKRENIYLSNLIITSLISIFYYFLFSFVVALLVTPILKVNLEIDSKFILLILVSLLTIIVYSSVFTFLAMLISNKTITAVANIIIALCLIVFSISCLKILNTPPTIQNATIVDGEVIIETVINPKYPSESKRKIIQTLNDINPTGQMFQIFSKNVPNLKLLPVYSLGLISIFTGAGLVLFKKKNIK